MNYLKKPIVNENDEEEEESENEENVDYEDVEMNFTMTSKEEYAIVQKFEMWMIGPDGLTPKRSALQHRSVVISAIKFLAHLSLDSIFDSKQLIRWVQQLENRNRQPGTVKSYLG